jgi:cyclic dehypoxanthinyl futalosine synthase
MGISREQALDCFASDDLIGIGMEADAVRRRLHPEGVVSYAIDHIVDLSSTTADLSAIDARIAESVEQGGTGVVLRGVNGRDLDWVEHLLRSVKQRFPEVRLQSLSAPEVLAIAQSSRITIPETFTRLIAAGLDSMPGDGASLIGPDRWIMVHRAAHQAGIPTTAAMVIGAGETMDDRVAFLESVSSLQDETGGFTAFTLSTFHAPNGRDLDDATAVEYLKTLAICRMLLDNINHVQTNWEQQGLKVLQMGLRFGGNDVGSILGATTAASEEEVRRVIRDAGFKPAQRDTLHRTLFLN